jgi:AcrR family transcriptional regulator
MASETSKGQPRERQAKGRKRAARRDLLLEEAARRINAQGAGAIVLNDIAEQVGLSRNTLYYYVADRADLVFRCYLRACEATADDLALAHELGADPADRIRRFVAAELDFERPAQAVLTDVDYLPEPQRGMIREQQGRNLAALQGLIADGVDAGAFRACDTEIAAQTLLGLLSWARLSAGWLDYRDDRAARRRAIAAIADLFLNGFAADPEAETRCAISADTLVARPFNAFDRQQTNEVKIGQLIAAASRLFNRRGIDGVSLDEISASVGATKGAVYHYFDDKADLVVRCYRRAFELFDLFMDTAVSAGRTGFERALISLHLNVQAQASGLSPLMLQPGRLSLPADELARFSAASRRLRLTSTRNMRQGLADGTCRAVDASFASDVAAGIFLWLPKWLPEGYPLSPVQIADEIANLVALGVVRRPGQTVAPPAPGAA